MMLFNHNVQLTSNYIQRFFLFSYLTKSIPREISHGFHDFCWYTSMEKTEGWIETKIALRARVVYKLMIYCIIIRLTHTNVQESMGKPCSCMQFTKINAVVFTKLRKNSYQVLQVMGATSKHAKKLKVCTITLSP